MVEKLETPFHHFVALAQFDRDVQLKGREIVEAERALVAKKTSYEAASLALQRARAHLHELKKNKAVFEHELLGLGQELERKKIRMDKTSEAREYTALMNEIELLTTQYQAKEAMVLEVWQQIEDAEPALGALELAQGPELAQQLALIAAAETHVQALKDALNLLKGQRAGKLVGILPEWLSLYESIRVHVEDPAAVMEKNLCSGCGSMVPPISQIAARHHQLVLCQQCRRLLYVEDARGSTP